MLNVNYILTLWDCYPERQTVPWAAECLLHALPCVAPSHSLQVLLTEYLDAPGAPSNAQITSESLGEVSAAVQGRWSEMGAYTIERFHYSIVFNEGRHLFGGIQVQPFPSFEEPLGFQSEPVLGTLGRVACAWQELLCPDPRAGFVTLTHLPHLPCSGLARVTGIWEQTGGLLPLLEYILESH